MRDHTKLRAFELADEVVLMIYQIKRQFPAVENFGLTSQMRRAAISAPSNIVEGFGRNSKTKFKRFLDIAFASIKSCTTNLDWLVVLDM